MKKYGLGSYCVWWSYEGGVLVSDYTFIRLISFLLLGLGDGYPQGVMNPVRVAGPSVSL